MAHGESFICFVLIELIGSRFNFMPAFPKITIKQNLDTPIFDVLELITSGHPKYNFLIEIILKIIIPFLGNSKMLFSISFILFWITQKRNFLFVFFEPEGKVSVFVVVILSVQPLRLCSSSKVDQSTMTSPLQEGGRAI